MHLKTNSHLQTLEELREQVQYFYFEHTVTSYINMTSESKDPQSF